MYALKFCFLVDNKSGKKIPGRRAMKDFTDFAKEEDRPKVSSQHALAVYQFLSTGGFVFLLPYSYIGFWSSNSVSNTMLLFSYL